MIQSVVKVATLLILLVASGMFAQESATQDIKQIRDLEQAIKASEELLAKFPRNDFTPNVMFQLVELYANRAVLNFQREMLIFETAEQKYEQGLLEKEPVMPQIDHSDALKLATKLLATFPNVGFQDKVKYRIAFFYLEQGDETKAMDYFEQLAQETNEKKLLEEAYFRLGEHYFEKKHYRTALDYYDRLLQSWDSPYFDMALYKLGWSHYNLDNYTDAIGYFLYLIGDVKLLERLEGELPGKTKTDLRQEAIEYVAICFAEFGGAAKAREFLAEYKDKDFTPKILLHLTDTFQERNFYEDAIAVLEVLLGFYPLHPEAPYYQKRIVENYELANEQEQADLAREVLIAEYGPGSRWLNQLDDADAKNDILKMAEEFLYILGTTAQERARQNSQLSFQHYEKAILKYGEFLEKFAESERADNVNFYLAECYFETANFAEAAVAYYNLILHYSNSEFGEIAAYNKILAYNNLFQSDTSVDSTELRLNFLGQSTANSDSLKARNNSQTQLLQACNDFYVFYPESDKLAEVMMNYAQNLYELEYFEFAKQAYNKITDHIPQHELVPQALLMMAHCDFKQGRYIAAEKAFHQVVEIFPDSSKYVERANKMIASSKFKNAHTYLAEGDTLRAAEEFLSVSAGRADPEIAERALFEAALQFESLGESRKAIGLYKQMTLEFPKSELVDEALLKAAVLSEELSEWQAAAESYLALYKHEPDSQLAEKALFLAAKNFEIAGDFGRARGYFQEYTIIFPDNPDRYLEAAFKRAEIAYWQKLHRHALQDLQFVIETHGKYVQQNIDVENYIAANAQYLIAEIAFKSFDDIQLGHPLKKSLARKRKAFEKAIKEYTAAAKYKVAEYTTASSFKIGQTFEEFANAIFSSPRPKLSASDLKTYDEKLWQTVLPFKEKALQAYQANIKQATENQIENNWVMESRKRVEALSVELELTAAKLSQETGL